MSSKYRKLPVVIDAHRWFMLSDHQHVLPYKDNGPRYKMKSNCQQCTCVYGRHGWIHTLEGGHIVCPGDWIITGVKGELYPCKSDVFEATYEPAN